MNSAHPGPRDGHDAVPGSRLRTADYVVVGAGSAGCVLAERLSADPDNRVILLEAGNRDPNAIPEIRVPMLFPRVFGTAVDWAFETVPQPGLLGRRVPYPRGKVLGGSSSINAQLWTRGHRADYDGWAEAGCAGWGYPDVRPYFERAERDRVRLAGIRYPSPVTPDFVTACAELGHPPAGAQPDGYALALATHHDGLRWSNADGYLGASRDRSNLAVHTGGQVRRVLFDGTHAVGVEVAGPGGIERVLAEREVILAAGAVGSPHLLMLSGIGPAAQLAAHGIPVLVDAPGVGRDMSDHLLVPLAFAAKGFESPGVGAGTEAVSRYLRDRVGPLDSIVSEALVFLRSRDDLPAPDIEIVLLLLPYGQHETTARHGLALGVLLLRPESRGTVTLCGTDPHAAPLIDPGFLTDRDGADLRTTIAGVREAQRILAHPALARWRGEPLTGGALSTEPADIERYVRRTGLSLFHPVGTARMGTDPGAVLDPRLRVRGTTGLRVVDAAAMPTIVRGHTHAPVTMLAERASDLILADSTTRR